MWKISIICILIINMCKLNSAESTTQIAINIANNSNKQSENMRNVQTQLDQALSKILEGLVPLNLKFMVKSILGTFDAKTIFKSVANHIIPTASHNKRINRQCREDSWLYAESLTTFTAWALKMYDATGKIPEGIVSGNFYSTGHFDQCLKISGPDDVSGAKFTGKYCTIFLHPKRTPGSGSRKSTSKETTNSPLLRKDDSHYDPEVGGTLRTTAILAYIPSLGFCLPSSCSARDIEIGLLDNVASIGLYNLTGLQIVPYANEDFCTTASTQRPYDTTTFIFMFVFGALALFLVLGTAYDAFLRQKCEECQDELSRSQHLLLSFSVLRNGSKILDTKQSREGNLDCLHGIRFLSSVWVILGHSFIVGLRESNANRSQLREDARHWYLQVVYNGTICVDSFLFLSGLLAAYIILDELDKRKGKLSVPFLYLQRFLRLTPVYAFLIAFSATLFVHLSSGPFWGQIALMSDRCRNSWWHHLLFINNFFGEDPDVSLCMVESWYLAIDMQFFLVSPIFIYALWYRPKYGKALLGVAMAGFTMVTMMVIASNNLPPTHIVARVYYADYYIKPWCRIMPYLVGIFSGYVLYTTRKNTISVEPWLVGIGWSVATSIAVAVLFGMYGYVDDTKVPVIPKAVSVLYGSMHRTAWAVSLSWVVFACVHGYGGFVNRFLSWPAFIPMSRITYSTYLVQELWFTYYYSRSHIIEYYTIFDTMLRFRDSLMISFVLGFIVSVCIEAPFMNLQKLLYNPKNKASRSHSGNNSLMVEDHNSKGVKVV